MTQIVDLGDGTAFDAEGKGYKVRNGRVGDVLFCVDYRLLRVRPDALREEGERIERELAA